MSASTHFDRKALVAGLVAAGAVVLAIYVGSRQLAHFDFALTTYATGSVLAAFAVGYRLTVWGQRPPSRMYLKRGLQLMFQRSEGRARHSVRAVAGESESGAQRTDAPYQQQNSIPLPHGVGTLGFALATNFAAQNFIRRRSVYRWVMHLCLSGGCTLAFVVAFPLVFGWVHFEPFADNAEMYRVHLFGFAVDSMSVHSLKAELMFNMLNISAGFALIGLVMAAIRRMTNAGERAVQTFSEDILPLLIIFVVTVTGLMLTVSYKFLAGRGHSVVAVAHTASVITLLFYIPFGKLFHMFQRNCSLAVSLYKKAGAVGPRAHCLRCGEDFGSQMHVDDLKTVLDQLGFNYRFATKKGPVHYQDICPPCRRRLLALNQGRTVGR